jgi:glycosyltransferase involved in cell wall biosynthesis
VEESSKASPAAACNERELYARAVDCASRGDRREAHRLYAQLIETVTDPCLRALITNDQAVLLLQAGDAPAGVRRLQEAAAIDSGCEIARANLALMEADFPSASAVATQTTGNRDAGTSDQDLAPVKMAILSFLFNWPSTGGGIIHTIELARFLAQGGYDVRHYYPSFEPWGIGCVEGSPTPGQALVFKSGDWNVPTIRERFRRAVDTFGPDYVLITDAWNMKPHLAEAMRGYRTLLRFQALECVCPLNNLRLLVDDSGAFTQCPKSQLATGEDCRACVRLRARQSGGLHRAERELAGVGTPDYDKTLRRALQEAAAILVLNPQAEALLRPFCRRVQVVPWGMNPDRFPMPAAATATRAGSRLTIFQAGLVQEAIKGYNVLHVACERLWHRRQDFQLVVTGDPPGPVDSFTHFTGWTSQEDLPALYQAADIVVVPTIAQEGLSRTSVEAMAAGRPVVASRIGGLPTTVQDGVTGLLCAPGDPEDLAIKLATLLDDGALRYRMGAAGRRRFEAEYTWPAVIEKFYRPLLVKPSERSSPAHSRAIPSVPTWLPSTVLEATSAVPSPPGEEPAAGGQVEGDGPPSRPVPRGVLGCVLAIQDRAPEMLERTLQTYAYQSVQPADKVLLDYGSSPAFAAAYRTLCQRYGWNLRRVRPANRGWHLSAAFNLAASALRPGVEVVFKSDVDVLLGADVLAMAAHLGAQAFCQFPYFTAPNGVAYPPAFTSPEQLVEVFQHLHKTTPSVGQGLFACPLTWFRRAGGFDLGYRSWGFEDHDLRRRAEKSLPVVEIPWTESLLVHQYHPPAVGQGSATTNQDYFERMQRVGPVIRNGGRLLPPGMTLTADTEASTIEPMGLRRVVFATRSLDEQLYRLTGQYLGFDGIETGDLELVGRVRLTGLDATEYFRELLQLDADWVVNIDEDAFLIDPAGVLDLIRRMEAQGYAACGLPDGGVVPIRRHNPVACNACFTVFDLRRLRGLLVDWKQTLEVRYNPRYAEDLPAFARRGRYCFDHFEPYYGLFFALRESGERILYLDGQEWEDGTSTVLLGATGQPLLIHAWYARLWQASMDTRARYRRVMDYASNQQEAMQARQSPGPITTLASGAPATLPPSSPGKKATKILVCVHVYDRLKNAEHWLRAWHQGTHDNAQIAIIHNQDGRELHPVEAIARGRPDYYLLRANKGQDIGAFQDVVQGRFDDRLPDWDNLLWCTDDFLPLRRDFLEHFLVKAADPAVGLVVGRYGYWPGHFSGLDEERHCRTIGFLIKRAVAQHLRFPAPRIRGRDDCLAFEHRAFHLMEQVLLMGYQVTTLDDPHTTVMWDANHEQALERWHVFAREFAAAAG